MTSSQKDILKTWFAAGLWLTVIAIESTTYLSADETSRFLYPIFHYLFAMDWQHFLVWHHYIRKVGHFVGYFVLSVLLFRAWKASLRSPLPWMWRWASVAFFVSAFVASMDEWHQSYLPTRTGLFSDVLLDSSAALTAQVVIFVLIRAKTRREREFAAAAHTS